MLFTNSLSLHHLKLLLMIVILVVISPVSLSSEEQFDASITLNPKHTRLMYFEGLRRVVIGNPDVVGIVIEPGDNHFNLSGLSPGRTDVTLFGSDKIMRYEVRVRGDSKIAELRTLEWMIGNIDGVRLLEDTDTNNILISAAADITTDEYERLSALASSYTNVIVNVVKPAFDLTDTVRMRIRFLEVSTAALRQIGIDWNNLSSSFQVGLQRTYIKSPFGSNESSTRYNVSLDTPLTTVFNMLVQNGDGRVLKEQSLLVESGATGRLFTGGEFPVTTQSGDGLFSTEYRPFGMTLEATPVVHNKNIHSSISFEMSNIDSSFSINGNPVLRTTRQQTQLVLSDKQAVIIGDFVGSEDAKTVRKLPGLSHLPIFGEFFKTRGIRREKTELLILLEPQIQNKPSQKDEALSYFSNRSESALKNTQFHLMD